MFVLNIIQGLMVLDVILAIRWTLLFPKSVKQSLILLINATPSSSLGMSWRSALANLF